MQGPYSLNGYRVRVYRQDSATQWFTGIITHHDLFTRTMIVMNDQVLEPQNVDPSMVQMTFLDDVVYSLLKGENIGITSRRRSRSNQNSNTIHGHYTRAQANSPRPAMNSQTSSKQRNARLNKRKGSDSSIPDEDRMKEERCDSIGRTENLKRNKHFHSKRRKPEEDEKKLILKRLRTENISDYSESSDSENSNKRIIDSSSEQNSENELKCKNTSKINGDGGISQSSERTEEQTLIDRHSPWNEMQDDKKYIGSERMKSADIQLQDVKPQFLRSEQTALYDQNSNNPHAQDIVVEKSNTTELSQNEQLVIKPPTPKNAVLLNSENNSDKAPQENHDNIIGLQASPKTELQSNALKPSFGNANFSDIKKQNSEPSWNENVNKKADYALSSGVLKTSQFSKDFNDRDKIHHSSVIGSSSLTDEQKRLQKQTLDALKPKPHRTDCSSKIKYNTSPDCLKSRSVHSPDIMKHKLNYHNSQNSGILRSINQLDSDLHRSSFHPVATRVSAIESTKSPLIIDKNEHFTVYRDPALVGPESAPNHLSPYLHQHNFALHSPAHRTCLPPNSHHPALTANPHLLTSSSNQAPMSAINAHSLGSTSHHSVHHPHLLPAVIPGMPPASLLGGHPQLETAHASSLSHLALAHQQQQQMLQHQSPHLLSQAHPSASYNQLGLYPIIWQYPNGSHAYPGIGLPSSKWVHPENHVNAEASMRRNAASPWLHQPTPVTSADTLLMGHLPVRPSSADPHRPLKLATHSSPPLSKSAAEHHKEENEKKAFAESVRPAPIKVEHEPSRVHSGKESHLHRHYTEPVLNHPKLQKTAQETGERQNKYKEEHRRILQENIESASFPIKMKSHENENYARVTPVVSSSPKSHLVKQENSVERPISELYKMKNSVVSQSLPQSNYFTTLSNSVANDPPRSFSQKESANFYSEKQNSSSSAGNTSTLNSYISSLSKPPPLIKHQPEDGSIGKMNEQLPQQLTTHTITSFRGDNRSPTQLSISSTNTLRSMPALHRAPVFHPPIHPSLDKKDSSYSNLSPPTLTPVQPVSSGGKIQELQKPPTLVPEPKEGSTTYKKSAEKNVQDAWKGNEMQNHSKVGWLPEKNNGKTQAATASVIVRPSSSIKYDNMPAVQSLSKKRVGEKSSAGLNQSDCLKPIEAREAGRIPQPIMNSDSSHVLYEKNSHAPSQNIPSSVTPGTNIMCSTKTDVTASAPTTTSVSSCSGSEVTYSLSNAVSVCTVIESTTSKTVTQTTAQPQDSKVSVTAPVAPVHNKAASAIQPNTGYSSSSDFIHLKKHKAALAAAQFKNTNTSDTESSAVKNQTITASCSPDSNASCSSTNTTNSVGNGQGSQCSQPNYHTKLKKAWLTRHSEEDKNTNKPESSGNTIVSEIIKPCTVNLIASTSSELQNNLDLRTQDDKLLKDDRLTRRRVKRTYESGSESGDSDESESKSGQRLKRQPKPTYKKKQNDMQRRKGDTDKEEEIKPNGILSRSAKEKSKLKLQTNSNSTGIPRSVLKDWRKVKKLKQTGESFLQDDSCCEIGPNLQKCRECRLIRTKKGEESTHSPVFCRFYYFRRLSFSKNGVVRIDGFSSPDQYDEESLSLWTHETYDDDELDLETIKYILGYIGDKFCQLVTSEKAAMSWVKKDAKIAWKRAVRGVREMCDACEATLFNIHWVCQKCGFVVCLDCYKAKERKSGRDKELYTWMKCVKGQPHDYKHLMATQIIPSSVLTDLLEAMHHLRIKFGIKSRCHCNFKQNAQGGKFLAVNGVSQVLQNVLNHRNKISLCLPDSQSPAQKPETNGNASPGSDTSTDSKLTSTESHSSLHWLADLAEQKSREEKKENKESPNGKHIKEERELDLAEAINCKTSSPISQNNEPGSTLRDLLTTTAGKLRLGSTDAGIAFAPVYSVGSQNKSGRSVPNILDDIIASVVENKIPAARANKPNIKPDPEEDITESCHKPPQEESAQSFTEIPHSWICERHILWLRDHKHGNNWKLFRDCWKQGKTVVVSGTHKKMNASLWKSEAVSQDFGNHQGDLLNCKEGVVSSGNVKEFWDGFEDVSKRQKLKTGETILLKLKDQPSGDDFKNMMSARHEDFFKILPVPEYCNPDGKFNLASHMPSFFVRPDLGPRMCSAYGVIATRDQDTGTTNLHIEVSDLVNILVYVGAVKGNGAHSKAGVLKKFEEEDLDDSLRKRLKDSCEMPGALWHVYETKDADKIREFLHKAAKEQCLEILPDHDPIRDQNWYLSKKLRQSLLDDYGVKSYAIVQFLGDAIILPAGAIYQVQNFHSCIQVTQDFVSPEHLVHSFHLTQELRLSKDEINYDDKLQVKNILYHSVKEMVRALKIHEEEMDDMEDS
ncbi:probable JmjC domain-containing histone demethylation protein 2C isoform X2 [Bombina bombina]|nr:probable JmjC domain-containing histone demethylation protein 2C isoform X2 [Bombina bombina]XP_053548241.1 probable JmjC domain-containing histone demethylation protein 2C isoform X2 [Bombina bombina]